MTETTNTYSGIYLIGLGLCLALGLQMLLPSLLSNAADIFFGTDLGSRSVLVRLDTEREQILMKTIMILTQTFAFGLTGLLLSTHLKSKILISNNKKINIFLAFGIAIAALPSISFFMIPKEWIIFPPSLKPLEESLISFEEQSSEYLKYLLKNHFIFNLVFIALVPAVMEEIFFRLFILGHLRKMMNVHFAIWITGFIFSLLHFQIYGFIARLMLGVMFGYMLVWSASLIPAIMAHFMNNAISAWAYFRYSNGSSESLVAPDYQAPAPIIILFFIILGLLLYVFYYINQIYYSRPSDP